MEVSLPIGALFGQETLLIDLTRFVAEGLIPSGVSSGSLKVSYEGFPGALLLSVASVDQTGNFVATARVNRSAVAALAGVRWRTDGYNNTVLTVQNIDSEATNVQ
ncbi:MAG: hypothetical protein ACRD4T_07000, partial [Candidatus Acidiferrales bacterium]